MREWIEYGTIQIEHKDHQFNLEIRGEFHKELYGQDADGNRGIMQTFCDNLEVHKVEGPSAEIELELCQEVVDLFYDKYDCDDVQWEGSTEKE